MVYLLSTVKLRGTNGLGSFYIYRFLLDVAEGYHSWRKFEFQHHVQCANARVQMYVFMLQLSMRQRIFDEVSNKCTLRVKVYGCVLSWPSQHYNYHRCVESLLGAALPLLAGYNTHAALGKHFEEFCPRRASQETTVSSRKG